MGYGIKIKNCPKTCESDCYDHVIDYTSISFNFSKFREYWHVRQLHGHTGVHNLKILNKAEKRMVREGISECVLDGQDGWTSAINIFLYHTRRFIDICKKYPTFLFFSDQV
jgi:hypothetical protein